MGFRALQGAAKPLALEPPNPIETGWNLATWTLITVYTCMIMIAIILTVASVATSTVPTIVIIKDILLLRSVLSL